MGHSTAADISYNIALVVVSAIICCVSVHQYNVAWTSTRAILYGVTANGCMYAYLRKLFIHPVIIKL